MKGINCKLNDHPTGGARNCKLQIAITIVYTLLSASQTFSAPFSFDDIEFWVGTGANRSALVIDWMEDAAAPPALAWGYRWDGAATGSDMLTAIVAADPRLFGKLGGSPADPVAVYGVGYDADGDGVFGIDDGTVFDAAGFAFSGPADLAAATDAGDYYAEGWFTGFWHYGVEMPAGSNPYDGGSWSDAGEGMAGRDLVDGSWDSWIFSPTFDFTAFAENPVAAPSPFAPGDFNRDSNVDASDYNVWSSTFGSTTDLAADANGNGSVDAADYVIWRDQFVITSATLPTSFANVPEPVSASCWIVTLLVSAFAIRFRRSPQMNTDERRFRNNHLRSSVDIGGRFSVTSKENVS